VLISQNKAMQAQRGSARTMLGIKPGGMALNALLFHALWVVCVVATESQTLLALGIVIVLHQLFFVSMKREWLLIALVSIIGISLDNLILNTQIIQFNTGTSEAPVHFIGRIPLWLACLWVGFSMTLMHGFYWLATKPFLSAALGLLVVPVTYYTGARLSDAVIVGPTWHYLLREGLLWAAVLPLSMQLATLIELSNSPASFKAIGIQRLQLLRSTLTKKRASS
jgi:hypothetical protein